MVIDRLPPVWTVEEYLAFEADSDTRHEYIDGEIYDMTGGTNHHSEIIMNVAGTLYGKLLDTNCSLRNSDMRVKASPSRYLYPDLSAVCGEPALEDNSTTLLNPILALEVTSPSSMLYDRVNKLEYYRAIPSIQVYLVIDQHRVYLDLHTRSENGWLWQKFSDLSDVIPLEALHCSLPLSAVYRGIHFEQA